MPDTAESGTYAIDPAHSRVGFVARHAMVTKVRGSFNEFEGSGNWDADDPSASSFQLTIKVASVDTRNADRDGHLRTNDFFDAEKFPEITFASTSIEPAGGDNYRVTGDLTIKDVTKPVTLDVEYGGTAVDAFGNHRLGLDGTAVINRKDWGLTWNMPLDAGGLMVSEKVTLEIEVSALRSDKS